MPRYLFIVDRGNSALFAYIKERFAGERNVEVILDRRASAAPTPPGVERRQHPEVNGEIRARSYAVVTLP
jgi:hypothetical protein